MDRIKTHYEDLEVAENASPEIIHGAYRYLSQKWLPDNNPERRDEAERITRALNEAYAVLSDPELRREYDTWIATQRTTNADQPAPSAPPPTKSSTPLTTQSSEPVSNPQATLIAKRSWGRRLLYAAGIAVLVREFGLWSIVILSVSSACFVATKGRSKPTRYSAAAGGFLLAILAGYQFFGVVGRLVFPVNQSQPHSVQSPASAPEAAPQAVNAASASAAGSNYATATQSAADEQKGSQAWQAWMVGDYATALAMLKPLAEEGNANAQLRLGWMYDLGTGVPKDYAAALEWFRKAAAQGNGGAQNGLGELYYEGEGVPQDYAAAAEWYRKAAAQGVPAAQVSLGELYGDGQGVPQDVVVAYALFNLSVLTDKANDNPAKEHLSTLVRAMTPAQIDAGQALTQQMQQVGVLKALDSH